MKLYKPIATHSSHNYSTTNIIITFYYSKTCATLLTKDKSFKSFTLTTKYHICKTTNEKMATYKPESSTIWLNSKLFENTTNLKVHLQSTDIKLLNLHTLLLIQYESKYY